MAKKYGLFRFNSRRLFPKPRKLSLADALGEDLGFSMKRKRRRRRRKMTISRMIKEA